MIRGKGWWKEGHEKRKELERVEKKKKAGEGREKGEKNSKTDS